MIRRPDTPGGRGLDVPRARSLPAVVCGVRGCGRSVATGRLPRVVAARVRWRRSRWRGGAAGDRCRLRDGAVMADGQQAARDALRGELCRLREAAGGEKHASYEKIKMRTNQLLPPGIPKIARQRVHDWINGNAVPQRKEHLSALVSALEEMAEARVKAAGRAPSALQTQSRQWWRQLHAEAAGRIGGSRSPSGSGADELSTAPVLTNSRASGAPHSTGSRKTSVPAAPLSTRTPRALSTKRGLMVAAVAAAAVTAVAVPILTPRSSSDPAALLTERERTNAGGGVLLPTTSGPAQGQPTATPSTSRNASLSTASSNSKSTSSPHTAPSGGQPQQEQAPAPPRFVPAPPTDTVVPPPVAPNPRGNRPSSTPTPSPKPTSTPTSIPLGPQKSVRRVTLPDGRILEVELYWNRTREYNDWSKVRYRLSGTSRYSINAALFVSGVRTFLQGLDDQEGGSWYSLNLGGHASLRPKTETFLVQVYANRRKPPTKLAEAVYHY